MINSSISITTICVITLIAIILTYLDYYFNKIEYKYAYIMIGLILIWFNPYFIYLVPLFVFDTWSKNKYASLLGFLAYTTILINIDAAGYVKITLFLLSITSLIISIFVNKAYKDKNKILNLEDSYFELESKTITQKKQLLESQDNEVYYATLNERARISREIHDNVGHILSSSIIQLGAIKKINDDARSFFSFRTARLVTS